MTTLDQLFVKHNCDKGKLKNGVGHDYTRHYAEALEPLRDKPIRILEIGVGDGKSIRVWEDYFTHPQTQIFGMDKDPVDQSRGRYTFLVGDQTNIKSFEPLTFTAYDVIIDDGSHTPDGTITAFEALWPFIKRGGYYFIEDLRCSYMPGYQVEGWGTQMAFVKRLLDDINMQTNYSPAPDCVFNYPSGCDGGRGIEWLKFSEELCILKKR